MNIRNSAKAVILNESKVLLTKNIDREGAFYLFPGGGQDHGETLVKAVQRECIEETGAAVVVGDLLHIREYIGKNHEHAAFDAGVHQIEYYFLCKLTDDSMEFSVPTNPDSHQISVEWVDITQLQHLRLYPRALIPAINDLMDNRNGCVYLGDVN